MYGISPWHIRFLCENQWEGGRSYTPREVGNMTPDMVYGLLCDKKLLRKWGKTRTVSMKPGEAGAVTKDGKMKGRTESGEVFEARVGGQSLTSLMWEREREKAKKPKRKRRGRK